MLSVRRVLTGLALAFTAYLAARGFSWTEPVERPYVMVASLALYLVTTWLCLFVYTPGQASPEGEDRPLRRRSALPVWAGVLALANAAVLPSAAAFAAGDGSRTAVFATWYIGGIGALMTILVARRRPALAWIGTALLAIGCSAWIGVLNALSLGVVGSIVWVSIAHLMLRSMDRAALDTEKLAELQRAASAWQASQSTRQRERRVRVQLALAVAGPVLTRVVAGGGVLTAEEQTEARIAEGRLRDELRGARLLDDDVRAAIDAARRRGASVTVFDEGGLDDVPTPALDVIRAELAGALREASSGRLIIRTSPHEDVAVTVVGRSAGGTGLSDEDGVDLWLEIEHPKE